MHSIDTHWRIKISEKKNFRCCICGESGNAGALIIKCVHLMPKERSGTRSSISQNDRIVTKRRSIFSLIATF